MSRKRTGSKTATFRRHVAREYGYLCHLCGRAIDPTLKRGGKKDMSYVVDHLNPHPTADDEYDIASARPAHYYCNSVRGTMSVRKARDKLMGINPTASREAPAECKPGKWPGGPLRFNRDHTDPDPTAPDMFGDTHQPCQTHWNADDPKYFWIVDRCGHIEDCFSEHTADGAHTRCSSMR